MKLSRGIIAVALIGLVPLRSAAAQSWMNWCYPGQLYTCFSAQLTTTNPGSGGTNVLLKVRNESAPTPANQASWLTAIGFSAPSNIGASSQPVVGTDGTVGVVGNPFNQWFLDNRPELGTTYLATSSYPNPSTGGIRGCGPTTGNKYFVTCSPAYTGWVTFSFHTAGVWQASQAQLAVKWQGGGVDSYECSTNGSITRCEPPNVVPEPVTMILLGSGLAGMGGVGVIRRRKKDGDIENA